MKANRRMGCISAWEPNQTTPVLYSLLCLIGLGIAFHPTWLSHFTQMPGEPGDTRLNQYFLEHSWRWISDHAYRGTLYSPSFFYPYPNALAFSDNLFGMAPLYWLLRLGLQPDFAFVGWLMAVSSLNFAAMVYVLQRWQVQPLLAGLGGFLFAFPVTRMARISHIQLFPHCMTPLALWVAWDFLQQPRRRSFSLLLLLIYWQMASGIYLGWLLGLSLLVLTGVAIGLWAESRLRLRQFIQKNIAFLGVTLTLWGWAVYVFLLPYLKMKRVLGGRSYRSLSGTIPRLQSWLSVPPQGHLWSKGLRPFLHNLPSVHEHFLFLGFGLAGLMAGVIWYRYCRSTWMPMVRYKIMIGFAIAAGVMMALALIFPARISLWWLVYHIVPGTSVIRAVGRIGLIILPCLLIAGFVWLDSFLKREFWKQGKYRRQWKTLCLVTFTLFIIGEQVLWRVPSYDGVSLRSQIQTLSQAMVENQCQVAYYSASHLFTEGTPHPHWYRSSLVSFAQIWGVEPTDLPSRFRYIYAHLIAMWAGISVNVPVVNGYSGYSPHGYDPHPDLWRSPEAVLHWLESQKAPAIDRLCFIRDRETETTTNPRATQDSRPTTQTPQSADPVLGYDVEVLRYPPP
ncbi:MAG: hypothetical protein VKJ24_17555 [Synechococcales bacterium]|nr:hypothetical protein [Synechococcales bacterium]